MPKAAMLSHRNLMANAHQTVSWAAGKLEPGKEAFLCLIPFFHVFGMTVGMNSGISLGATLIVMPQPDLKEAIALIEKFGVTMMPGVPTLYVGFNNFPGIENRKVGQIKICVSGAAPLPVEVARRFEELTGGKLIEGYGLTESSPVTHANPLYGLRKVGSIGVPFPSVDAKVVEVREGQIIELPLGEEGELAVKGPNIMMAYWHRNLETAQTLIDGWLLTGDIAKQDEDGYFYIVDRKKDMVLRGGENIYCAEVESSIYRHNSVAECCVFGVPDDRLGEEVGVAVVAKPGEALSPEALREHCAAIMAKHKVRRYIWMLDEPLPRNASGKFLKRELRDKLAPKVSA
jgi:long-chain acyl-CoA synthetase